MDATPDILPIKNESKENPLVINPNIVPTQNSINGIYLLLIILIDVLIT